MKNQKLLKAMVVAGLALGLMVGSALSPNRIPAPTLVPSLVPVAVTATYPTATADPVASLVAP